MAEKMPLRKQSIPSLLQQLSEAQSVIQNMQQELKIEAALERLRSRTMGMHNSDELPEVVQLLYKETEPFGISTFGISLAIFREEENTVEYWFADHLNSNLLQSYKVFGKQNKVFNRIWHAWKKGEPQFQVFMEGQEKWDYDTFILEDTEFSRLPQEIKEGIRMHKTVCFTITFFKYGYFESVDLQVPPEENAKLLIRFTKVFEQTYTRFLDLQKAEAQTLEAEIQLALEKVRAQTMAMQKTSELRSVIHTLFEQLKTLGFEATACGLSLFNREDKSMTIWLAGFDTEAYPESYHVPYFDHPHYRAQWEAWEKGVGYQVFTFEGDLKRSYDELIFSLGDFKDLPASAKEAILSIEHASNCTAFMKYGMIESVIVGEQALSGQQAGILRRFAKVFEQTYTRFLDLKKTEEQAREAQIEAALERVRSRTMAMHGSDELEEIIRLIYQQLIHLKIHIDHTGFIIDHDVSDDMHIWLADLNGPPSQIIIPYFDSPHWNSFIEAKQKGLDFFTNHLNFEEKNGFYQKLFTYIPELPEAAREFYFNCPGLAISTVLLDNVGLYIENFAGIPYTDEENLIVARFGKVFQQTYTRFIDLQKAEAQAREAEIQLALERVRARTMAMHKSEELSEAASVLFQQIIALDLKPVACAFIIVDAKNKTGEVFISADGTVIPDSFTLPYYGEPAQDQILTAWKEGAPYVIVDLKGKKLSDHLRFISENMPVGDLLEASGEAQPDRLALHIINFKYGFLGINYLELNEKIIPLLQRFAQVFEQTYTRFLDLKKAEAQAREAQIEASLERVRSRAVSMRTSDELSGAAELLYQEFLKLGVESYSCGYLINDDENGSWKVWLTNPGGPFFKTYWTIPYDADEHLKARYESWKRKESFHSVVLENETNRQHHRVISRYAPWKAEMLEDLPVRLVFNSAHFTLGHLFVISPDRLTPELEQAMVRFAGVFDLAYRRFLDLQLAEANTVKAEQDLIVIKAARQKAEEALTELQTTQKQLIHAEKMASLGELTAGIAHEIQNPLNFVNNFSEINSELIDEMKIELEKGNLEEVKTISGDIKINEEKIKHHGKRAEAIVKSMLQHSRTSSGTKELTDINTLCEEYIRLAYHGFRAKDPAFTAEIKQDFDPALPRINVAPQDMGRVILNILNNAFQACTSASLITSSDQSRRALPDTDKPTVSISTRLLNDQIEISISDNGPGIPQDIKDKIFQPFFTTKPAGQGTGLGLSLSYDIVKAHGGELKVKTNEGEGTEFLIELPIGI